MLRNLTWKPRFSMKSLLVLILGIAIGFSLNLETLRLLVGPSSGARMRSLPLYVIEPPDILDIRATGNFSPAFPSVSGRHLVGPDGRINLGTFGQVYVSGMTISEAQEAIRKAIAQDVATPRISLDVFAYNSKRYYVITRGMGVSENVVQVPITGNETVLDAIAQIGGVQAAASTKIWVARPAPNGIGGDNILPVDWNEVSTGASTETNYQLLPGDRVFVSRAVLAQSGGTHPGSAR